MFRVPHVKDMHREGMDNVLRKENGGERDEENDTERGFSALHLRMDRMDGRAMAAAQGAAHSAVSYSVFRACDANANS